MTFGFEVIDEDEVLALREKAGLQVREGLMVCGDAVLNIVTVTSLIL
jgi:hypothetical protein